MINQELTLEGELCLELCRETAELYGFNPDVGQGVFEGLANALNSGWNDDAVSFWSDQLSAKYSKSSANDPNDRFLPVWVMCNKWLGAFGGAGQRERLITCLIEVRDAAVLRGAPPAMSTALLVGKMCASVIHTPLTRLNSWIDGWDCRFDGKAKHFLPKVIELMEKHRLITRTSKKQYQKAVADQLMKTITAIAEKNNAADN